MAVKQPSSPDKLASSPKKDAAVKALCCVARDISPESRNPDTVYKTRYHPRVSVPGTRERKAVGWPSLTPSDVLELQEIVPTPKTSTDIDAAIDGPDLSKGQRTSMVKLIKKKLSQTSSNFKTSPSKHHARSKASSAAIKEDGKGEGTADPSADPLLSNYDPDAELIQSTSSIVADLVETAEKSASQQLRRAQRGNIRSEDSDISPVTDIDLNVATAALEICTQEAPVTLPPRTIGDQQEPYLRQATDHCATDSQAISSPTDANHGGHQANSEYHLSRLSFENNNDNIRQRTASRMSEILEAVDPGFDASVDRSPICSGFFHHARDKADDSRFTTSSKYSQPSRVKLAGNELAAKSVDSVNDKAQPYISLLENVRLRIDPPRRQASDASVHLQHMRISQHLRSLSGLSGESTDLSDDHVSNDGFDSNRIPSSWGNVIGQAATKSRQPSENVRAIKMPAYVQKELDMKSTNSLISRLQMQVPPIGVDGPTDRCSEEYDDRLSLAPPSASSARTVGTNYEETAAMWSKALATHQDDLTGPPRKRGTSFSTVSRRPSRRSRQSIESPHRLGDTPSQDAVRSVSVAPIALGLERITTSLSFDRLAMPNAHSASQPSSPSIDRREDPRLSERLIVEARHRSVSSPPISQSAHAQEPGRKSQLLVSGGKELGISVPDITLSEPLHDHVADYVGPFDHLPPSQRPWARYPSMNRENRNGSASVLTGDDVMVRDFQPKATDPLSPGGSMSKIDRLTVKEKAKIRATAVMLRRKLLDLPSTLKPSNSTFRRREHGHRSSIAMGGALEYPELELLPSSAPRAPTVDAGRVMMQSRNRGRQLNSASASSNYEALGVKSPIPSESGSDRRTSSLLASQYQHHIQEWSRKRSSESISPLDGNNDVQSSEVSPGSKSLPERDPRRISRHNSGILAKSHSRQELRQPTYELNISIKDKSEARVSASGAAGELWK